MSMLDAIARHARNGITRWREPHEGEPSYGFIVRLAEAHRFESVPPFATTLMLGWTSSISPEECLAAACAAEFASDAERERLALWTPVLGADHRTIAEETIRRDDFTLRSRRFCPACLAEEGYHRVWFDLAFMDECPLHGLALQERAAEDGPLLTWNWATMDALSSGERLAAPSLRLPILADTLEGYTLRRLGLAETKVDAFLDSYTLGDVVEGAELLGRLALGGWTRHMPLINEPGFEAVPLRKAGWLRMREGAEGVKALLEEVADKAPKGMFGARKLFGWGYYNLSFKSDFAHHLRDLMVEVAADRGLNGRRYVGGWRAVGSARAKGMPLDAEAAKRAAGVSALTTLEDLVRLVGDAVGMLDVAEAVADRSTVAALEQHVGRNVALGDVVALVGGNAPLADVVARISERLTVRETAQLIGETEVAVVGIGEALGLFLPHNGRKGSPLLVSREMIPRFVAAATSVVTRSQAAKMLGVYDSVFAEIVQAGHLKKFAKRWETRDDARRRGHAPAGGIEDRFEIAEIERFLDAIPLAEPEDLFAGKTVMMAPHVMTLARMIAYTNMDGGDLFGGIAAGDIAVFTRTHRPRPVVCEGSLPFENALDDFRIRLFDQRPGCLFQARWLSANFTREQTKTDDALSQRQACALLDILPPTAKVLTDLGFFELLPSKDRCDRQKLARASVERFAARYAAGTIYAAVLGCIDSKVPARARLAGVKTLLEKDFPGEALPKVQAIYDRTEMRQAFGLKEDPDAGDPVRRGWKTIADRLGLERNLFALWQVQPGMAATFSTADRAWPIEVSYRFGADVESVDRHLHLDQVRRRNGIAVYEIRATLDVGGKLAADGYESCAAAIARGVAAGVEASAEPHRLFAAMKAVVVVDDEGLSAGAMIARHADDDARLVALMLNTIKGSLEEGRRSFDPAVFGIWPVVFTRLPKREAA